MRQKPITFVYPVINQEASMIITIITIIIIIKISLEKRKRKLNISFKYSSSCQRTNKQTKFKDNQISNLSNSNSTSLYLTKPTILLKKKIHKIQRKKTNFPPTFLEIPNTTCVIARPYNMYYSSLCHCAGKRVGEQSRPRHGCLLVRVTESRVTRVDYNWTSIYPFLLTLPTNMYTHAHIHTQVHIYNERHNRV